jgi:DNA-binding CsgD family transcriptional regulator
MGTKLANRGLSAFAAEADLIQYRVQLTPAAKRGRLLRVHAGGAAIPRGIYGNQPCWEFLQDRSTPCSRCPLFGDGSAERGWTILDSSDGSYQLLQATQSATTGEVRLLRLSSSLLGLLCRDKLQRIAQDARLSQQELRVLEGMAEGFQTKEIASQLHISTRTVKFHGMNLLRKLGAESRIGLLKLLLSSEPTAPSARSSGRAARADP